MCYFIGLLSFSSRTVHFRFEVFLFQLQFCESVLFRHLCLSQVLVTGWYSALECCCQIERKKSLSASGHLGRSSQTFFSFWKIRNVVKQPKNYKTRSRHTSWVEHLMVDFFLEVSSAFSGFWIDWRWLCLCFCWHCCYCYYYINMLQRFSCQAPPQSFWVWFDFPQRNG